MTADFVSRVKDTKRVGRIVDGGVKVIWQKGTPVGAPDRRQLEVKLIVEVNEGDDIKEAEAFLRSAVDAAIEPD